MKRRPFAVVLFVLLIGVMGAGGTAVVPTPWIKFDEGQPVPNPGGVANKLEGKGTYNSDPGIGIKNIALTATQGKFSGVQGADYLNGNWGATMPLVAGQYEVTGLLDATTDGINYNLYYTKTKTVTVK